ncbi:MAG: ABC transporter ATP-binding protein [Flavobacteriales bacterium]
MAPAIEVRHVSKSYASHQALRDVSLSVPQGAVFGLMGPNGAGKTTLIRIINQITGPDSGEVLFYGTPLQSEHVREIGYLPEERGLYKKMKVGEQCVYLAQLKGMDGKEAHNKLKEWFERFEMTSWWNKTIEDLSKGMAQKIQFVSTVLHEPKLLILDEPFSGFDPINAEIIRNEMLRLKELGTTIILSTHDMGSVEELCDHIGLINRSQLILNGSVQDVKESFRTNTYKIAFQGTAMDLGIGLWAHFELVRHIPGEKESVAEIKLMEGKTLNDLLSALIPHIQIQSVNELIPTMDQIFIQAVNQFNASHE